MLKTQNASDLPARAPAQQGSNDGVDGLVCAAREYDLRNVDVAVPRDAIVAFTGVSGSDKSSLAFGTVYAEAESRYFQTVAAYARRFIQQRHNPKVKMITGLPPPAAALQRRRGTHSSRSRWGPVTTLSSSLRMLFSRAGRYPEGASPLDSDAFSPEMPAGACSSATALRTSSAKPPWSPTLP